jgi:hypothetical protein
MKDRYLGIIRSIEGKEYLEWKFPEEHLGIGDRLIFNRLTRETITYFEMYGVNKHAYPAQVLKINEELRRYGFKPLDIMKSLVGEENDK